MRILSLWFNGDTSNAAEQMYVSLANANGMTRTVYHDNPNAALIEDWMEWTVDLTKFSDQDVDLTDVDTISIGFGDKNNPGPGGKGQVFFDDIRLYRSSWPNWPVPVELRLPPTWPWSVPVEPELPLFGHTGLIQQNQSQNRNRHRKYLMDSRRTRLCIIR